MSVVVLVSSPMRVVAREWISVTVVKRLSVVAVPTAVVVRNGVAVVRIVVTVRRSHADIEAEALSRGVRRNGKRARQRCRGDSCSKHRESPFEYERCSDERHQCTSHASVIEDDNIEQCNSMRRFHRRAIQDSCRTTPENSQQEWSIEMIQKSAAVDWRFQRLVLQKSAYHSGV